MFKTISFFLLFGRANFFVQFFSLLRNFLNLLFFFCWTLFSSSFSLARAHHSSEVAAEIGLGLPEFSILILFFFDRYSTGNVKDWENTPEIHWIIWIIKWFTIVWGSFYVMLIPIILMTHRVNSVSLEDDRTSKNIAS